MLWPRKQQSIQNPVSIAASSSWRRYVSRESSQKSVAQIAHEFGIPDGVLYRWRRQLQEQQEQAFPGKGHQSELEEENRCLRRELEWVQQERYILKKAIAIFSHGHP